MADTFQRQFARTRRFTLGEPRAFSAYDDRVLFLRSLSGTDARTGLWMVDLTTGAERLVVDPAALVEGDLPEAERARRERVRETATGVVAYAADDAGRVVSFAAAGLWVADVDAGSVRRLDAADSVYDPRVDPTGQRIAYVSGTALRVINVDGTDDREVAAEPDSAVSWGRAEFVAAEEMDRQRGYWWSPDGVRLLAARVDENPVPVWWIADPAHPDRAPLPVRYPHAGANNATVSLHLLDIDGDKVVDVRWDSSTFPYLARASWTSEHQPLLQVFTRDQRRGQVLEVDVSTGETQALAEDSDPVWVEPFPGVPAWCGNDVVRIADVDGARRLLVGDRAVSPPEMYVRGVAGAGDAGVVFTATLDEPAQVHVFRWSASGIDRLTTDVGVHGSSMSAQTVVLSSSSLDYSGQRHRIVVDEREIAVASYAETPLLTPSVRLLRLGARELCAGLLLPSGHQPGTKLPVLLDPYGGPHGQLVLASRRIWLESQWWADQGYAVLVIDGRGTPGRGPEFERSIYQNVSGPVLEDQVDGLHAAAELEPDLDLSRVAIRGWSFGGYLAALAVLRRPDVFHAAVAGAPSADWAHYDTHYTERYLGTPQEHPEIYEQTSLLGDAANLSRPLLLIHGLADDNVVAAHTLLLSQRLTEAGRPHSVLPLTGVTHMTPQEAVAENLLLLQVDFLQRSLAI